MIFLNVLFLQTSLCFTLAQSARLKFLQRSKSHDEPSGESRNQQPGERERDKPSHSSVRTGRIHRKGARIVHSRSPSVSPSVSPRPSYHRRKPKDQFDSQNLRTQGEMAGAETDLHTTMQEEELGRPQLTAKDEGQVLTEKGLQQRLTKDKALGSERWQAGSSLTSPASQDEGHKTASDSFVSFSSLDTVVSLVDHAKCVTSPLSAAPVTGPDTPTRRKAVRLPAGKGADLRSTSGPSSCIGAPSALEQIKGYGSPAVPPGRSDNGPRERKQGPQYPSSSPTHVAQTQIPQPGPPGPFSPQLSPTSPPPQPLTHSGSSSQTSPSHVTSFSSSPNDSPVRKPSFSSSATSPTRHFSYSSSSTMDSPTHKLFVSYRNSPSHRTGLLTSPTREGGRKTSFSSSSHGSPVRKPSFSSSSESQHQQIYSSTTSSQSSILSSPTHAPGGTFSPKDMSPVCSPSKGYMAGRAFSPTHRSPITSPLASPDRGTRAVRSGGITNKGFVNTTPHIQRAKRSPLTSPSHEPQDVVKYGRPPSPKMESGTPQHQSMIPKPATSAGKDGDADMTRLLTMSSRIPQIPRSSSPRYASPPKPSTLKLKDQARAMGSKRESPAMMKAQQYQSSGAAPLSSPDPDTYDAPYTRPKVKGLVSRFERNPCGPSGTGDVRAARQGGPLSFSSSESRPSTPAAESSKFSPPAYTYTSPLSSSRPSGRSSHCRPSAGLLSPFSPQQPSALSSPSMSSRPMQADESSVSSNVYVARCDSSDSLSANESSSLLRDEEKSDSMSSLYYADEDIPDAV